MRGVIGKTARICREYLMLFGFDPVKTGRAVFGLFGFVLDYFKFRSQKKNDGFVFGRIRPCFGENRELGGTAKGHYFHQDLLVASRIFDNRPQRHVDVGSRVDGFVAHVASFRDIAVVDIRPQTSQLRNIEFVQADLMTEIPAELVESCDSLSCLHVLEHFGLGRYGDPLAWDGHRAGFDNLMRMLKPSGKLYLSVPIGAQRIEFNAHRVFSVAYMLEMFSGGLQIDDFSYVDDNGDLHPSVALDDRRISANYGCSYGCGIFEMTKLPGATAH